MDLPLLLRPHQFLADLLPRHLLLRRGLGRNDVLVQRAHALARLDPAHLRPRPGRAPLGPDLVGRLQHGPLAPLGARRVYWVGALLARALALARRARSGAGRGRGHDPPEHPDPRARRVHLDRRAGAGLGGDSDRESRGAECDGPGTGESGYYGGSVEFVDAVVLGRFDSQPGDLCGLFQVLPSRAVDEALIGKFSYCFGGFVFG